LSGVCCDGCEDGGCAGVLGFETAQIRDWIERRRISPSGLPREAREAIELLIDDLEAGDA
jgi:hypothetical protein